MSERIYEDEVLVKIYEKYIADVKYIKKITYRDLTNYAIKIGYENMKYEYFYRSKPIKALVEKMNSKRRDTDIRISENGEINHYKLNVEEIVEKHFNDKAQLKLMLKIFKEGYDKAFDELKKVQANLLNKEAKIQELELECKKLSEQKAELKYKNNQLKEKYSAIKDNKRNNAVLAGIKYVIEECNVEVNDQKEMNSLMSSFGIPYNKDSNNIKKELEENLSALELEDEELKRDIEMMNENSVDMNRDGEITGNNNVIIMSETKKNGKIRAKKPNYLNR